MAPTAARVSVRQAEASKRGVRQQALLAAAKGGALRLPPKPPPKPAAKPSPKLANSKKGDPAKAALQAVRRSKGAAQDVVRDNSKKTAAPAAKPAAKKAPAKAPLPEVEFVNAGEALVVDDELVERTALQAFIAAEPDLTDADELRQWYDAQVSEIDQLPRVAVNKDLRSAADAKLVSVDTDIAKLRRGKQPAVTPLKSGLSNPSSSSKISASEKAELKRHLQAEMQRELKRLLDLQTASAAAPRVLSNFDSGSLLSSTVPVNSHAEFLLVLADSISSLGSKQPRVLRRQHVSAASSYRF